MTTRTLRRRFALLAALVLCAALPLQAQDDTYHVLLEWTGGEPGSVAGGLFFFRGNEGGQTNTLLVETPSGARIIGKERLDAVAGTDTFLLQDDDSGWWIEVRKKWPRQWDGLSDFFARGQEDLDEAARRGEKVEVLVRTPDGVIFDGSQPVLVPGEDFEHLGRALAEQPAGDDLGAEVPADLAAALPFLESVLGRHSSMGSKFGPLVGLLRRQVGIAQAAVDRQDWSESTQVKPGLLVKEPTGVELLRRFERSSQDAVLEP